MEYREQKKFDTGCNIYRWPQGLQNGFRQADKKDIKYKFNRVLGKNLSTSKKKGHQL